ncbi:MAG TPA: surface lipoprotein assembly modifier [Burkholderiales bacterium]|nr:surface lipoprotein assembly modifier [Burkholderiales bacterium]
MRAIALVLLLVFLSLTARAADESLALAREHLLHGRAQEALKLLDPLEAKLASNREYNYLLAQALLDIGQPARALFPINRILRRDPNDATALLMLSRARMALGQAQPAREALDRAKKGQQPAQIAERINQYLSIIAAAEEAGATRFGGHLEVSVGYDTNVNSATGATQIALPVFGGAIGTLSTAATKQSDSFATVGGSVGLKYPLTANLAVVAAAGASQRLNSSHREFDLRTLDGSTGLRFTSGPNEWTGVLSAQQFEVDYQRFRTTSGGSIQWRRVLAAGTEVSAFGQVARLAYPSQGLRDADRYVAGIAVAHALGKERAPIVFTSVYAGKEDERADNVPFFGHRLKGIRFGVDKAFSERFAVSASIAYEERDYGGQDPLFLVGREDDQFDFRLAALYAIAPQWILIPQLTHTYNRSNLELNRYRRTALFLALRYAF